MPKLQHQKDINGCGIACLSNLLDKPYDWVKEDFERKFYTIEKGIKIFDIIKYLKMHNLNYASKFFNQNKKYKINLKEADKFSKIKESITLIIKNNKYPIGHYLLRVKNGWVDPWYNFPSVDNVGAKIRKELPNNPWYVLYPSFYNNVSVGTGKLAGKGVFANRSFKKGEVVIKYNLKPLTKGELKKLPNIEKKFTHTHWGVTYLYSVPERYVNHSLKPNTLPDLKNQCDVAVRDIKIGEAITTDATKDDV